MIFRTKPTQSVETTFKITRADRDLVRKTDYDVQVIPLFFLADSICALISGLVVLRI